MNFEFLNLYNMNWNLLDQMITEKYIHVQKHPSEELYIYNYTAKTQYEWLWNEWTIQCRGLIMDAKRNIVARPLKKFFNLEELQNVTLPNLPFEVYEKVDGSMGVLYWWNNEPAIATRGSFASEQALKATEMLHTTYKNTIPLLDKTKTYIFEIIYPQNRIVVNYGNKEVLILLAVLETETGKDFPLVEIGFPIVQSYDGITDFKKLQAINESNREGFVIKFENGFRFKLKFEEYKRLHRIMAQVSNKSIWENMMYNQPLDEMLELVPDEFYEWVRETRDDFLKKYETIEAIAKSEFKVLEDRKTTAAYFLNECTHPRILFAMLDNKPYDTMIWRMLKPEYEKPLLVRE